MPRLMDALERIGGWLANPHLRRYEWGFSSRYWTWREFFHLHRFSVLRKRFEFGEWHQSTRLSGSALWDLVKLSFPELFLIILAMAVVGGLELVFLAYAPSTMTWVGLDAWAVRVEAIRQFEPDARVFEKVGEIVAPLSGLFLSIFFAAMSIVASSVYAKAPSDVRQMFMRERANGFYMRMLSRCVGAGMLAFGAGLLGQPLGLLNLSLLIFLALFGVLSFGVLGLRVLDFFDPARLTDYFERDLAKWIAQATPNGYQWDEVSFQAYYNRKTQEALRTYGEILALAREQQPVHLAELLCRAISFLPMHIRLKKQIPTDSHWFKQRPRHLNWLTTGAGQADIALRAGVGLRPQPTPDHMWFEGEFERIVLEGVATLLKDQRDHSATTVALDVQKTLHRMANHLAVEEALRFHGALGTAIRAHLGKTAETKACSAEELDDKYNLELLECYACDIVQILLGLSLRIPQMPAESFGKMIREMKWQAPGAIYRRGLPRTVVKQLEFLRRGLLFEWDVEGKQCSPVWYLQEVAGASYVEFLRDALGEIMTEIETCYVRLFDATAGKRPARAATLIEVGLEACNKCTYHFGILRQWQEDMAKAFRIEPEIPWPEIDWLGLDKRVGECRKEILRKYAALAPSLASLPVSDDWPDYFGHAYNVLADECFKAMVDGDEALFDSLYTAVFDLCLRTPERLRPLLERESHEIQIIYATESLADLMCLSGIAMIFSELDGKTFWPFVKVVWDFYIEKHPNARAFIERVFAGADYRDSLFALTPRSTFRTQWTLDIHRLLSGRGLTGWVQARLFLGGNEPKPPHKSNLINVITRSEMPMMDNPDDIFIALYLAKHPQAHGLKIPRRAQMFAESNDRFDERHKAGGEEDE